MKNVKTETRSIYLPALGIACALGLGKQAVTQALFAQAIAYPEDYESLLSGRISSVKRLPFDIPDVPADLKFLNSRTNGLLRLALDEIAEAVVRAKKIYGSFRIGVVLATNTAGMLEGEQGFFHNAQMGSWPEDYHYMRQETASPSVFTSLYCDVGGPSYTISTACSAGSKALCSARRLLEAGVCDAVIAGGVDTLCQLTLNGFDALDLLSEKTCSPFSKNRKGLTLGEGAAVFLVTREKNPHEVVVEFLGAGESSDAYHISSPDPSGQGAELAIREALDMASIEPQDIAYINLHGTATLFNDAAESQCTQRIFGENVPCSSTKALTGHALGAAGAIEAGFLWLALSAEKEGTIPVPPHVWDGEKDLSLPPLCFSKPADRLSAIKDQFILMSNSFAFGGSNVSLIFSKKSQSRGGVSD